MNQCPAKYQIVTRSGANGTMNCMLEAGHDGVHSDCGGRWPRDVEYAGRSRDALERARGCIKGLLARTPVRDVAETLAEIDAALANQPRGGGAEPVLGLRAGQEEGRKASDVAGSIPAPSTNAEVLTERNPFVDRCFVHDRKLVTGARCPECVLTVQNQEKP